MVGTLEGIHAGGKVNAETHRMLRDAGVMGICVMEGDKPHRGVLAENVTVTRDVSGFMKVEFDFLCPNCGNRHWATEYDSHTKLFQSVGWTLKCGWVGVRMPWASTPDRDKKSVYGRKADVKVAQ
jgi:hypothetical protein